MVSIHGVDIDLELARKLQEEYDREAAAQIADDNVNGLQSNQGSGSIKNSNQPGGLMSPSAMAAMEKGLSPVDSSLEFSDPNPDIRELFLMFNVQYFWGRLDGIEVKWSPRMTLCAGLCVYEGRGGLCSVRLSLPLLKLRPRKDLVETLLHEMIHAYLFVTDNDRDHDGHGPQFQSHMRRINKSTGASISIYHTFHDEVASYQQHWWRCNGPCQQRRPYYGYVKRAMNRAPSARDPWWAEHQATCGGTYTKIKEPEGYGQKKSAKGKTKEDKPKDKAMDIRAFVGKGKTLGTGSKDGQKINGNPKPASTSSYGKVSNPASIFNVKSTDHSSSGPKNTTENGTKLSVIVNGVLIRKGSSSGSNPLFTTTSTKNSGDTTHAVDLNSPTKAIRASSSTDSRKNNEIGSKTDKIMNTSLVTKSNVSSFSIIDNNFGKSAEKYTGNDMTVSSYDCDQWPDDEDDSWMLDVDITNLESDPKSNSSPQSSLKQTSGETIDLTVCNPGNSKTPPALPHKSVPVDGMLHNGIPKKKFDPRAKKKPIFKKSRNGEKAVPNPKRKKGIFSKNFVSVCEGGDFSNPMTKSPPKKRKKYVFDELDSNDGLWNEKTNSEKDLSSREQGTSSIIPHRKAQEKTSNVNKSATEVKSLTKSQGTDKKSQYSVSDSQRTNKQPFYVNDKAKGKDNLPHEGEESYGHIKDSDREKTIAGKDSVITESQSDKSGKFTGKGFKLGNGEAGISFLSQIRKTFHKPYDNIDSRVRPNLASDNTGHVSDRKRSSGIAFGHQNSSNSQNEEHVRKKQNNDGQRFSQDTRDLIQDVPHNVVNGNSRREDSNRPAELSNVVPCPVCSQSVPSSEINQHLDLCLMTS